MVNFFASATPTMVLELMRGGDLRNFLIRKRARESLNDDRLYTEVGSIEGTVTSRELLNLGIQVCKGLGHLQRNKVSTICTQSLCLKMCSVVESYPCLNAIFR